MTAKSRKQMIRGWIMFDWANSAYNLVIVSTIFPAVFMAYYKDGVNFMGIEFKQSESLLTLAISFSYLILVMLSPILSGIADFGGYKKRYMQFFSTLGAISCACLIFFQKERLEIGLLFAVLASIGFSGSFVFYNAFLPEIVPTKFQDKVSAKGFAFGYFGSSLLLILIFILLTFAADTFKVQYAFLLVGIWWFGWARWTFNVLPGGEKKLDKSNSELIKLGFGELKKVWGDIRKNDKLKKFLSAFFMIDLGVQTVVIVAAPFATKIAGMEGSELIIVVLIMQFVGILGSILFSKLSDRKGNLMALGIATAVYLVICVFAFFVNSKIAFYCIAGFMGLAMGGVQSLCRSTYSKLLPQTDDHASYFSFYDIVEKVAITIGTFCYGALLLVVNARYGVLGLSVFFTFGILLLIRLGKAKKLEPHPDLLDS